MNSSSSLSSTGLNGGKLDQFNKQWKVSDSFKANKLRVSTREELKKKREAEEARKNRKSGVSTKTSDSKSYLKSRRQRARDENKQDILGILDENLDKLECGDHPASPQKKNGGHHHHHGKQLEKTAGQNRLRSLNPFRRHKNETSSNQLDHLKRSKSDRRTSRRRKEQKEAMESVKQTNKDKESEMQEILDEVLRRYPKEKCKTFADHKEFAFAELTVQSNKHKEVQIDNEKFRDLKSMLQDHLARTLPEDDSVAESAKIDESEHHQPDQSQITSPPASPRKSPTKSNSSSRLHRHLQNTSPKATQSPSSSPLRTRSTVPSPNLVGSSPSKNSPFKNSPVKERNRIPSPTTKRPKSSQSMNLSSVGQSGMKLAPFIEKDDITLSTENDDESTLVPVVKLILVDPNGEVGKYTGTICVNTGKPHGSGKLEYENSACYTGDWSQGSWSGYGRHIKPNGDVYEGNFFDNAKHGHGVYRYRDGKRVFEGRYVTGQRVEGKMTYGDGSVYKGQWYEGKRHGRGIYKFKDSSVYKGEFQQDVIHGVGQLIWPDNAKYVGEWNQGQRHGMGKEYDSTGKLRYEGSWKDGVPA
jgi:hypothetical protein